MSHAATNWAIQQRGLKPTTKIVLWHLCDRFNPDFGCFPTQARLADDCEIGRATLNRHLDDLEARRLIKRVRIIDTKTGQQRPTRYLLGFEFGDGSNGPRCGPSSDQTGAAGQNVTNPRIDTETPAANPKNAPKTPWLNAGHGDEGKTVTNSKDGQPSASALPCPKTGHGPVSHFDQTPCLKKRNSRVSKWDTNLVREPLRKPVKEEEDAQARDLDLFFEQVLRAVGIDPAAHLPGWWQGSSARRHVQHWRQNTGLTDADLLQIAADSRSQHPAPPDGPKALDRAFERAVRSKAQAPTRRPRGRSKETPPVVTRDIPAMYADWVNSDKHLPSSAVTNVMRDQMLARGLVTPQRLRERGIT